MGFNPDIVRKYLNGKFSLNDKILVDEYFDSDHYNSQLNGLLKDFWEENADRDNAAGKNLDQVLDRINHRILLLSNEKTSRFRKVWLSYSRIAALLLLPVLLFSILILSTRNTQKTEPSTWVELHSPYGARIQFNLPDGSKGWLNGGSVLKYPAQFGSDTRRVALNGEAFFEVAKNPRCPFIVDANQLKVKVLGTSFNVESYENDSISEVVVETGKVEVSARGQILEHSLMPSERLVFNRSARHFSKSSVEVQDYTSWKTGKLIFLNDNLEEVARKVSRFYNIDLTINNNVDKHQLFRAIMEDERLEEVLRYMKLTMDIDFIVQERKVNQEGQLSKLKITIINNTKK